MKRELKKQRIKKKKKKSDLQSYHTDLSYILKNNEKENLHSRHVQRQRGVRWHHKIRKVLEH